MALSQMQEQLPPALSPQQVEALCAASASRLESLRAALKAHGSALVAFSGGVDSTFLLRVAVDVLGERAVALTALSASVAEEEREEACLLARRIGARHLVVDSKELDDPRYAANPSNRCYFCKNELFTLAEAKRQELGLSVVLDGFNADDKKDHRPGHQAAREHRVGSPLADAGLTKNEIRAWSHRLGLPTWDKPQMPCLASRLPYGTAVTVQRLTQVGAAEKAVKALGFVTFRVRHHGEIARLELSADELPRVADPFLRAALTAAVKSAGFRFVVVDLEPFRSGRLNDALPASALALPVVD